MTTRKFGTISTNYTSASVLYNALLGAGFQEVYITAGGRGVVELFDVVHCRVLCKADIDRDSTFKGFVSVPEDTPIEVRGRISKQGDSLTVSEVKIVHFGNNGALPVYDLDPNEMVLCPVNCG